MQGHGMSDQETATIAQEKAELRRTMIATRDALLQPKRFAASRALLEEEHWEKLLPFLPRKGGTIATYIAMRSELDPGLLVMRLVAQGYALACPRVTPAGLTFHRVSSAAELVPGPFGTREPPADAALLAPDLFLTPLLAFDAEGFRLGYGKAYYDRAFAAFPKAKRIGIAFGFQRVAHVPRAPHDLPLHAVLAVDA
jgi:5-formyltetrahydrofolate cyclo-ligase